ncbi:phosphate acyltransferase, partial [Clostridium sp.]
MELMKQIWAKAKTDKKKIVLAEGEEERNIKASEKIVK